MHLSNFNEFYYLYFMDIYSINELSYLEKINLDKINLYLSKGKAQEFDFVQFF